MFEVIELAQDRLQSADIDDLQAVLRQVVGQPFLSFQVSYGDELQIHLGQGRPMRHPRLQGMTSGSYIIGTRASSWSVRSAARAVLLTCNATQPDDAGRVPSERSRDIHVIESGDYIPPGTAVQGASAFAVEGGYALSLRFGDDSEVFVIPPPPEPPTPEDIESPVADWEIFTPRDRLLTAGPGRSWSYLESR